ncbi:MAG: carbohydrate kinase family protein [Candidatus Lokiarchaeota archaeon]|nr:carbohydrate kinase family protein [Candidatus Lokiarchaeota archaeon]
MKQVDIVGLGEIVLDWVTEIPHFPKPDEKIDALSENYFPGGVTANYLVAVARLGGLSGFIGAVGDDLYGELLIDDFIKESVDTTYTKKVVNKRTPVNFIFVTQGEKTIIQSPHMHTTKIELNDLNESYIADSILLHTTIIHQNVTEKAIEIAKRNNVKISIDLESQIAQRGWNNVKNVLLKADVLLPNKEGAKSITNSNNPEKAAEILVKKGIPIVIITLGSNGALITTKDFQKRIPTYDINHIIDTTGAGDTFNGAFSLAYWIKGWDLEKSCIYANAAASLKIQTLGARSGMPYESELIEFLKKNDENFF